MFTNSPWYHWHKYHTDFTALLCVWNVKKGRNLKTPAVTWVLSILSSYSPPPHSKSLSFVEPQWCQLARIKLFKPKLAGASAVCSFCHIHDCIAGWSVGINGSDMDRIRIRLIQLSVKQEAVSSQVFCILSWYRSEGQLSLKLNISSNMHLLCLLLSHKCLLYGNKQDVRIAIQAQFSPLWNSHRVPVLFWDNSHSLSSILHAMAKAEKEVSLLENRGAGQHWSQGQVCIASRFPYIVSLRILKKSGVQHKMLGKLISNFCNGQFLQCWNCYWAGYQ